MNCFVACGHEMTGSDRARHHRVNACEQEHGKLSGAERQGSQRQQRQGREVDLKLGAINGKLLWLLAGEQ